MARARDFRVLRRRLRRAAQERHDTHHDGGGCGETVVRVRHRVRVHLLRVFDEELRRTYSFSEAFSRAKKSIAQREREQKFEPSNPQIHVGEAIAEKLREVESRLRARHVGATAEAPEG